MNSSAVEPSVGGPPTGDGLPDPVPDRWAAAELILEVLPRAMRRIRQVTRRASDAELTVPQVRALLYMRRWPGTDLSGLADHLGVSRPAASALVERLVRGGLVDRTQDPRERRRVCLVLSSAGVETVGDVRLTTRRWLADALVSLTPEEVAAVATALPILDRAVQGGGEP